MARVTNSLPQISRQSPSDMSREDQWMANFKALREFVKSKGHFCKKHTTLNNWVKYQRKRIAQGKMPEYQLKLFNDLSASRLEKYLQKNQ